MKPVLAIDPGNIRSAFVVWDGEKIDRMGILENDQILSVIDTIAEEPYASNMAIEMIASYGMAVGATVFDTCVWIGRFIQQWSLSHDLIYRKDVKMHLCGSVRAKDANIRQSLIDRFGPQGTKKNSGITYGLSKDLWAAFAVAVTWWDKFRHD